MPDTPGHVATRRDDLHTVTLRELEAKIVQAGIVISRRQIMRHCKAGTFDAQKLPATNNVEEWFIAPDSIEKGIADIKALQGLRARHDATRRDMSDTDEVQTPQQMDTDTSGHDATRRDVTGKENRGDGGASYPDASRYVALLERDNDFLRDQVKKKDDQISDLSQRFSETQILLGAMQKMLAPMLGQADPFSRPESREVTDPPTP
jgi:hypothetical protein